MHALPQLPQLLLSACSLTQVPLQFVSPLWHESAHLPAEQIWPARQLVVQTPQLLLSFCRLTQVPLQFCSPLWQLTAHLPAEQT